MLEKLRINFDGRKSVIDDAIKTSAADGSADKVLTAAREAVTEGLARIDEIRAAFTAYRGTIPAFIDEFLAPEGIIVKKRDIDQQIEDNRQMVHSMREKARELRDENRKLSAKIDEYRKTLEDLKMTKVRMETRLNAVRDAVKQNERELSESSRDFWLRTGMILNRVIPDSRTSAAS